jgi:hypothetical protein
MIFFCEGDIAAYVDEGLWPDRQGVLPYNAEAMQQLAQQQWKG